MLGLGRLINQNMIGRYDRSRCDRSRYDRSKYDRKIDKSNDGQRLVQINLKSIRLL